MAIGWLNICWIFSCLEGDTFAVFLHHPALPVHSQGAHTVLMPCSHPQCSMSCGAAAATAGSWSGAGLQGVGVGASRQQAWRQQHLPSGSSSSAVLSSGHVSFVATCAWDTPASICWLALYLMRKQIPICQHMQLSHCWVILESVY